MPSHDERFMRLCLAAALKGSGRVSPNPLVGAVVARRGRLVSVGYHRRYGGEHAETMALRRAGRRARGATLYVTLEPCAHHGKTPPCVDAVRAAGIVRVVAAMGDPHPLVDGRGFRALRRAGIRVSRGLFASEARDLNAAYVTAILEGRPLVTLKAGISLDGRIATASGESRWITSATSRREAHRLRAAHDAVLIGIGTALADDPRLTARAGGAGRSPIRVLLDTRLRVSSRSLLLRSRGGAVLVYTAGGSPSKRRALARAGASVVEVPRGPGGVRLRSVLADLVRRGAHSLLVEGGSEVAWSFLREGVVDRLALFVAPTILGGRGAVPFVGGPGVGRPAQGFRVARMEVRRVGGDLLISGRLARRGLRARRG